MNLPLPIFALAFLLGICATFICTDIPQPSIVYILGLVAVGLVCTRKSLAVTCALALLGFSYMSWHIDRHLEHTIPINLTNKELSLTGTISSVVEETAANKVKFLFQVNKFSQLANYAEQTTWDLPAMVQLTWDRSPKDLLPGDTWSLTVKLKRPRNYANPGSFDSEKFYFQQRIVALGYVRPKGKHTLDLRADHLINQTRQKILQHIHHSLSGNQYAGIIIALVLGVKTKLISAAQMQVLQNTGTAHLMAISGLHIGLVASLVFMLFKFSAKLLPRRRTPQSTQIFAAWAALVASIIYVLLAGLGIATQRAIIMVIACLGAMITQRKISGVQTLALALLGVLIWDPFAVLSLGFWFSFGAVALIFYALRSKRGVDHGSLSSKLLANVKMQLVMFVGLLPLSLLFFMQSSLIAPLANFIAIPWVSVSIVPFSLLGIILTPFNEFLSEQLLTFSANNFALLWSILEKLAQLPTFIWTPPQHLWLVLLLAILGICWLLAPRGIPARWLGVVGLLPLVIIPLSKVPYGQAEFTLLDVGQGLAAVIRTRDHVLVYDTGAKLTNDFDLGARVVAPFLQTKGITHIDTLVISHPDNDHIGGAASLLAKYKVDQVLISDASYLAENNSTECKAGQYWEWEDVKFTILHPAEFTKNKKRNDQSCVLLVEAGDQRVLLTGDIETKSEKQLIANYGKDLHADIILVPHHGSKTSSSLDFIQHVKPKFALIPVGYQNQYGHPKLQILERYAQEQIPVMRTDLDGAISFILGTKQSLSAVKYRKRKKFWHIQ